MTNDDRSVPDMTGVARPTLADLPELSRPVGLYGALRHVEVGGSACFGIVITLAVYAHHS